MDIESEHGPPAWRAIGQGDSDEIRGLPESFDYEAERFEGFWFYEEACARGDDESMAVAVARIIFGKLATDAIRRRRRGEDLREEIAETLEYLKALTLTRSELGLLRRLADSLEPFDPSTVGDALVGLAWCALRFDWPLSARCFAELAYEAGRTYQEDNCAEGAARALCRLATLEESPRAARRWRGRAAVLARRNGRRRTLRA